ncbi:ADP-ribosyltransferase (plasmid) [Bacillus cereus]|uniref:ADP-ribosyltransferase n=2 Tax=Bacillaceae TaxID=186817 RepID=UPI0023584419|nr:ADP-ribosyltransferase [Bacillus cereus]WCT67026.1 ADP-ribosyltransferase [Bacillus cereus]
MMPLTEKELQKQVKKGSEEKKEFEKKFESKDAAQKAELKDIGLKEKLKNGIKDKKWRPEDEKKVDIFLKQAPVLKEDLHITVRMTDSYKKEDTNKKETKDNNKVTTISNEFYTTENLSSNLENLRANEELIQIQIPAGERVGYFTGETAEDTRVLLRKNAVYQIDEVDGKTNTVIKGKMRVVWKAKLIKSKSENTSEEKKNPNSTFNAKEYGEKWIKKLTKSELAAMKKYTGDDYDALNTYLRTGEIMSGYSKKDLKQTIAFMDKAIQRASLPEEITVYRRSTEQEFKRDKNFLKHMFNLDLDSLDSFETYIKKAIDLVNANVGKTNIDKAYRSTSLKSEGSGDPFFLKRPIRVEITIPKGTHAPYLESISSFPEEKEILLPHGSKFKLTGASTVQETIRNQLINVLVIRAKLIK